MGEPGHPPAVTVGVDGQVLRGDSRMAAYANFVKVAHTVFALPFALVGLVTAARGYSLHVSTIVLLVVAFAAARFAAMGFNRIVDHRLDAMNLRTTGRELPMGRMSRREAWVLVAGMAVVFLVVSALINPLCGKLAPLALLWITSYSYAKRFTSLSHLWLGAGMAIAPVGGYLAVAGRWSDPWWLIVLLAAAVACWGAGFDVLYSLQDEQFDRRHGLKSLTVELGAAAAIRASRALHLLAVTALSAFGWAAGYGVAFLLGVIASAALLVWEHRLVRPGDYAKLNTAFFAMNGIISGVILAGALVDTVLRP